MTTAVETRLAAVARSAKARVAVDLASSTGQPVIDYCRALIDWAVFGMKKPAGAPTGRVQSAVRAAVNVGLVEVYGHEKSPEIDPGITTRRDVL